MALSIQKLNLDLSILRFEKGSTPEEFAKEISGVIGKDVWKYSQVVYLLDGMISEYTFYSGMGTSGEIYKVLEGEALMIDNVTKKQIGGYIPEEGSCSKVMKTKIGNGFKGYEVLITLEKEMAEEDKLDNEEGEKEDGNKTTEQQGNELGQEI